MSCTATQHNPSVVACTDLSYRYDKHTVVELAPFELPAGKSMAVLGPSGCGKTTLLHLLAGLLRPSAGEISILGNDIAGMRGAELDRFRGSNIGMVFQRLFLLPGVSVRENVLLAHRLARRTESARNLDVLLDRLGIAEIAHKKPRTLSQGQAQRVAIARALVHEPALVLADEPTSALDDKRAEQALSLLKETTASIGAALLIVTHDNRIRGQLGMEYLLEPRS